MKFLMDRDFSERLAHAWRVEQGCIDGELPLIKQDRPWDAGITGAVDTVMFDEEDGLWKAWYAAARPGTHHDWDLAYAESEDGLNWRKPELDIVKWPGYDKTNILISSKIGGSFIHPSVIKNPGVTGPKKWELYTLIVPGPDFDGVVDGLKPPESLGHHPHGWGFYRFFSPDGLHWTISDGPMYFWDGMKGLETMPAFVFDPRYRPDGMFVQRKPDGTYVLFQKLCLMFAVKTSRTVCGWGAGLRTWGRATSKDGLNWTPPVLILAPDDRDPGDVAMIELSVALGEGRHLGIFGRMHSNEAEVDLAFAAGTDDNQAWFRPGRRACLHNPPLGDIGGGQFRPFRSPIEHDGKLYMFFAAYDGLHGNPENPAKDDKTQWGEWHYYGGMGRAVWDADRLWAIGPFSGGPHCASVTTIPQQEAAGKALEINAKCIGDGSLEAELLDGDGNVIKGFSLADCAPLQGDQHNYTMTWKGGSKAPADGASVRFKLHRAWMYSFEWR